MFVYYPNSDEEKLFIEFVDYILFLKAQPFNSTDPSIAIYFERVIDGMVYELYFPDLLQKHNREIIEHLGALPAFTDAMSDEKKMGICKTVFSRLYDKAHPVSINLLHMDTIPEIKIIEGK